MKKQPEITEKTRQVFIDVFCDLYRTKPIEKISVQEISNKAGFNRSTFYQYFCDIYELLSYIENDVIEYVRHEFHSENQKGEQHSIKEITMFFEKKEPYLNALLGVYGSNGFYERFKTEFIFELEENDPLKNDRIMPYLIEFHISSIISLYRLWLRRQKDLTLEEFTDLIHHLLYDVNISPIY